MCKYWVLSEHGINYWFYQNSNYIQLLRNVSADKARHTWAVKKKDGLRGRRLEGTGFLQNTHQPQSRLPQEIVWVAVRHCFLGSASHHLSEQRLSRVCLVTMQVCSPSWFVAHKPSCDLVRPKHAFPRSRNKAPRGWLLVSIYLVAIFSSPTPHMHFLE